MAKLLAQQSEPTPAPAKHDKASGKRKARRGSVPYSVISAHLDEIALPPLARGADMGDHEPHHAPIGLTRQNSSKEEFDEAAAKWRRNSQNETPDEDQDEVAVDLNAD